jgi:hypothetical protein
MSLSVSPTLGPVRQHLRMWGALLVRRLPGASRPSLPLEQQAQGLFLLWLAYMGLLWMGAVLLWQHGVWHRLVKADPTGLTLAIVALFVVCSLWAGQRAWSLGLQWSALQDLRDGLSAPGWCADYLHSRAAPACDHGIVQQILGDRAHGPHEMAWWFNGIQLKLGLLGKVIGFSILALELGQMEGFDPQQSAHMLKSLTGGLGIALLTTITGLAGNILLGLQLMRLDRFADALVAETLLLGEQRAAAQV